MFRIYRYIALYLLVIFIYPLVFQPIHVVYHHKDDCSHGCYADKTSGICETHQHDTPVFTEKDEKCPICTYEFSINTIPEHSVFKSYVPLNWNRLEQGQVVQVKQSLLNKKTPRAPPFI